MLKSLKIENYALIDRLETGFEPGFTAITGETGAGKSILLGALGLVLGQRADIQVLSDKNRKCIVEASFVISGYGLENFFSVNDLDYEDELILRREISPNGKSRAYINDSPVNLQQIKEIGERLVNIHSQNTTLTLNEENFQLAVIDSFAGIGEALIKYRQKYISYTNKQEKLRKLLAEEQKARNEHSYYSFLADELLAAHITVDEQAELEEDLSMLNHTEEIKNSLFLVSKLFSPENGNIIGLLRDTDSQLKKVSDFYPALKAILERLDSDIIDLKDIQAEIEQMEEKVEFNPEMLEKVQSRLDLLYTLQQKHHVSDNPGLIEKLSFYQEKIENISSLENQIAFIKKEISDERAELQKKAEEISGKRKAVFGNFEQEVIRLIQLMGMSGARFSIRHSIENEFTFDGIDHIAFYFNANPGHEMKPMADTASGGELSRLMLGIKSLISRKNLLPTVIFDEIDNGISGDIAGKVGEVMVQTARYIQVIGITHLPQIAGKANHHFSVFKVSSQGTTYSNIRKLSPDERVEELAKMLSGEAYSSASLQTARELLVK